MFPSLNCQAFAWVHEWPFCRSGAGLLCASDTPLFKGQLNAATLAERIPSWLEVFATDEQGRVAMASVSHENMYWVRGAFLVPPQRGTNEAPRWKMADHELLDPESTQLLRLWSGQAGRVLDGVDHSGERNVQESNLPLLEGVHRVADGLAPTSQMTLQTLRRAEGTILSPSSRPHRFPGGPPTNQRSLSMRKAEDSNPTPVKTHTRFE